MGTQRVGTGRFTYNDGSAVTVSLGTKLFRQTYRSARTRYVAESDDLTLREVVTVGSPHKELIASVRFHDDPDELQDLIDFGLDGGTITYSPDGGSTSYACLLIEATDITPDPDLEGLGYYQTTFTLRATGATTSFDGLKALP